MIHYFPKNQLRIHTERISLSRYMAHEDGNDDIDRPVGWGETRLEAIADLYNCLRELGELED